MLTPFDLKVKSTAHAITLIHPKYWVPNFLKGPATVHQKQAMIPTEENQKRVEELILSISLPPAPKESEDVITPKQSVEFTGSGKNRRERFETKMRFTRSLERMVAFDPNADALFPGSIVQGRGLRDGLLIPIACDRDPVLITITDLALEEGALPYEKVDNPSLATVMGAIDRIRNGKIQKSQPARLTFTIIAANSIEEGFLSSTLLQIFLDKFPGPAM